MVSITRCWWWRAMTVMAQTREHLAILQLTGNPMLTVALTKADRVDEARVDEVERQG